MTKFSTLSAEIADQYDLTSQEAERFIDMMIGVMADGLQADKQLKVRGLGTFKVSAVGARESVDVNTGERFTIGEREKITFTPDTAMRDLVNRPFALFETVAVSEGVNFDEIDYKYGQKVITDENAPITENNNMKMKEQQQEEEMEFDEYGYPLTNEPEKEELSSLLVSKLRQTKWLIACAVGMMVLCLAAFFLLYMEIEDRNNQIEDLVSQIKGEALVANTSESDSLAKAYWKADSLRRVQAVVDKTLKNLAEYEQAVKDKESTAMAKLEQHNKAVDEERPKVDAEDAAQDKMLKDAVQERKDKEEYRAEQVRKADDKRMDDITKKASLGKELLTYNQYPGVKNGAYTITGIEKTITVQAGQTLAGISKAYLGAGMECYVEAVNGGIKTVKSGQQLKIPALKLKKTKK